MMATSSASDYQQSDTAERSGFIVDSVSDDVGKGIFSTKEFAAGETIFRERPLVSAQERNNSHRASSRDSHFETIVVSDFPITSNLAKVSSSSIFWL